MCTNPVALDLDIAILAVGWPDGLENSLNNTIASIGQDICDREFRAPRTAATPIHGATKLQLTNLYVIENSVAIGSGHKKTESWQAHKCWIFQYHCG